MAFRFTYDLLNRLAAVNGSNQAGKTFTDSPDGNLKEKKLTRGGTQWQPRHDHLGLRWPPERHRSPCRIERQCRPGRRIADVRP